MKIKRHLVSLAVLIVFFVNMVPSGFATRAAVSVAKEVATGWTLTTTDPTSNYFPTFLGNGYIAARLPVQGTGYADMPVVTQNEVAGFYDRAEERASLPAWSTLTFSDEIDGLGLSPLDGNLSRRRPSALHASPPAAVPLQFQTLALVGSSHKTSGLVGSYQQRGDVVVAGKYRNYRQTLDLHNGLLTTSFTWIAPTGHRADLQYQVLIDQAREHVAVVQITFTPRWSGTASVSDLLDGAGARFTTGSGQGFVAAKKRIYETVKADGSGLVAGLASQLDVSGVPAASISEQGADGRQTIEQQVIFSVVAGLNYQITKYIGITTSHEDRDPQSAAQTYASQAAMAGYQSLLQEHKAAWSRLWQSDIQVRGDPQLQLESRASMFYLLESARSGVNWSLSPGGLSSDAYKGHVFWDAETWMYPPLLLTHPDIAVGVDSYREKLLREAENNAITQGEQGARIGWESGLTGKELSPYPGYPLEVHVSADVALAQWQYYLATGDTGWLAQHGWPLIAQIAQFWLSRVSRDAEGGYSINSVQGPDEYHYPVDNSAYTNAAAATVLRIADQAAHTVGKSANPEWLIIANGLKVPVDTVRNIHPEFTGYSGDLIKQADVVMLQYPWEYPMSSSVAQSDLKYYAARLDPAGPSMSDAINAIDACALNDPSGAYDYLQKSSRPFLRAPFEQISETQGSNIGAFTFTTGTGGFLQAIYYGFSGLRWRADRLHIDPCLPAQIQGITLTGLKWQGRVFTLAIMPGVTTLTLVSGPAMPVEVGTQAVRIVQSGSALVVKTR